MDLLTLDICWKNQLTRYAQRKLIAMLIGYTRVSTNDQVICLDTESDTLSSSEVA